MRRRDVSQTGTDRTHSKKPCRCVCCDEQAAPWWVGIVAVLAALVFMAVAGWLDGA